MESSNISETFNKIKDFNSLQEEISKKQDEMLGFEHETNDSDEDGIFPEKPFDADKIRIESKILPLTYLMHQIDRGQLELHPEFQRNNVWDIKRKSLLIESLMLRIPIPGFYLYEDSKGNKYVVDGLQRLSTIHDFINIKFKLENLQYLGRQYNGKSFADINDKYRSRIDETQLTVNIIDSRNPPQVKYDIFRRVNTGGMPLKPQEIRNIVSSKRTRQFLRELVNSKEFKKATRGRISDLRMDAQELALKYLLYKRCYNIENMRPIFGSNNFQALLDEEIEIVNTYNDETLNILSIDFKKALEKSYALFGDLAFSKPDYAHIINKALFISWNVAFNFNDIDIETLSKLRSKAIKLFRNKVLQDDEYYRALSQSTSSPNNIKRQFDGVHFILKELQND